MPTSRRRDLQKIGRALGRTGITRIPGKSCRRAFLKRELPDNPSQSSMVLRQLLFPYSGIPLRAIYQIKQSDDLGFRRFKKDSMKFLFRQQSLEILDNVKPLRPAGKCPLTRRRAAFLQTIAESDVSPQFGAADGLIFVRRIF